MPDRADNDAGTGGKASFERPGARGAVIHTTASQGRDSRMAPLMMPTIE
jgi:hypothetical protein